MATPTDPAFGAGFDADAFRQAITSTMEMGMAVDENERVTFHTNPVRDYEVEDPAGNPYDWTSAPTNDITQDPEDIQVPVAVEFIAQASLSAGTPFGEIDTPKVVLTLLDEHYAEVKDADTVTIDGAIYNIDYVAPPVGLFDVTVYSIYCSAVDEA